MEHNSVHLSSDLTDSFTADVLDHLGTSFGDVYLRRTLLSKFADPDPLALKQRQDAALAKWLRTESRNARTNMRLLIEEEDDKNLAGLNLGDVLRVASSIIRRLIGTTVPVDRLLGTFSSGASTSLTRQPGVVARKYTEQPDVTQEAWDIVWPFLYRESPLWLSMNPGILNPRFVDGNVMFFVPKNNDIERVACKEPDLNLYLQKATGDFIRSRLKRVGINLNDQSINQRLAREGSLTGKLATLDLSSASDSVTTQLVCRLLSVDWFSFLDGIRCKRTVLPDGTLHENEMLSSMGNGFTFELESLIFYALVKAIARLKGEHGIISVYGDDIIAPSSLVGVVKCLFSFVGFTLNSEKTFSRGFFRESCGGHYYRGVDVTPFYIKSPITTLPGLIKALNALRRWASKGSPWCRADLWEVWQKYARFVPASLHGGYDTSSIESLASLRGPGKLLRKVTKSRRPLELDRGLYLEWQNKAVNRSCVTENQSSVMYETSRYVVIRPRAGFALNFGLSAPAFPQEYEAAQGALTGT